MRITEVRLRWVQQLPVKRGGFFLQWFDVQYKREGKRTRFLLSASCPVEVVGLLKEIEL
jgi:hypothetical protein